MDDDKMATELRQFLIDYKLLKGRLKRLQLEYKKILSGPREMKSVVISDMPHGSNVNNTEADMNRLITIQSEINQLEEDIKSVEIMFTTLDTGKQNRIYSRILKGYFIYGRSLTEIAEEIGVSKMSVSTYKKAAMYNLTVLLEGKSACKSILGGN